ncbi:MAG: hypothetical protein AAGK03_03455 [Pseudomonadota bacterium]
MVGVSTCIGLGGPHLFGVSGGVGVVITSSIPFQPGRLYEGQSLSDQSGWTAFVDAATYSAPGLVRPGDLQVTFTDDAASATDPGIEGEVFGWSLSVGDDAGTAPRLFGPYAVTIEYASQVSVTADNRAVFSINDLVPDLEPVTFTIEGVDYTKTAGEWRLDPPLPLDGTAAIETATPVADLVAGDVLTLNPGEWLIQDPATFALDPVLVRNGVALDGQSGETFTLTEADQGATFIGRITGTDDNGTAQIETDPITIPGGSAFAVSRVGRVTHIDRTVSLDVSSVPVDDLIYYAVTLVTTQNNLKMATLEIDAVPYAPVLSSANPGQSNVAFFKAPKAGDVPVINVAGYKNSEVVSLAITAYHVRGAVEAAQSLNNGANTGRVEFPLNVTPGILLAAGVDKGQGTGIDEWVGFDGAGAVTDSDVIETDDNHVTALIPITAAETPRMMAVDLPNNTNTHIGGAALLLTEAV